MSARRRPAILIAARHPSGAQGALAILAAARRRQLPVRVWASGPAVQVLRSCGVPVSVWTARLDAPRGETGRRHVEAVAASLTRGLRRRSPDVVIAMDATEQVGIDQLLPLAAGRLGIPSLRVRDAWGTAAGIETRQWGGRLPASLRREALATRYLEIDGLGVALSRRRLGLPADRLRPVGGLVTLDRFGRAAARGRRRALRRWLGVAPATPIVYFFAQPTRRERAEPDALDALVEAMNVSGLAARGVVLVTEEHPREADAADGRLGVGWAARRAALRYRGRVIDLSAAARALGRTRRFDDTLLAVDLAVSSYSNTSVEATAAGAAMVEPDWSSRPIGLHVMTPARVRGAMVRTRAGLRRTPFERTGAIPVARSGPALAAMVRGFLLQPRTKAPYFRAMRRQWGVGTVADRVLDAAVELSEWTW